MRKPAKNSSQKKVFIALQSQYSGHLSRGLVYIEILKKHFDLSIFTVGGKPANWFLQALSLTPMEVPGYRLVERKNGSIAQIRTALAYFRNYLAIKKGKRQFKRYIKKENPLFVISDFEPIISSICLRLKIPLVTIDAHRRFLLKDCPLPRPKYNELWDLFCLKVGMGIMHRKGNLDIALSFFPYSVSDENSILAPPLLRKEVLDAVPVQGDYLLVYHNTGTEKERILEQCKNFPTVVYGYDVEEIHGSIHFKKSSAKSFLEDLISCKSFCSRAGFEAVAEGLSLGKPCYVVPQKGQFEQSYNAYHASILGAKFLLFFDYKAAYNNKTKTHIDRKWLSKSWKIFEKNILDFSETLNKK